MSGAAFFLLLVVLGLAAVPLGEKMRIPSPVVAALFGVTLGLLPGAGHVEFPTELILPAVLPPLLYTAAWQNSWKRFLHGWKPILLLAVVLVFVTAAAVAIVATTISPILPLGAAVVLGAVTAPPDPAAISAVASRLGLSRRLITILEGEGLFNDVTALTLYQVAVAGVLTGSLSWWGAAASFGYSAVAGVGIGVLCGFLFHWLSDWMGSGQLRAALSLLVPYSAYVAAEAAEASGVLAVLTAAFWLTANRMDPDDVEGRRYGRPFWVVIELLVTGFTFGLVGMEFVRVMNHLDTQVWQYLTFSLVICLTLVIVRFIWIFAVGALLQVKSKVRHDPDIPANWRERTLVAWAGMRAVVTVATALALPPHFPGREQIVFVAVVVALVTLLLPGLTLPWLVRKLHLNTGAAKRHAAEHEVSEAATAAALAKLKERRNDGLVTEEEEDWLSVWQRSIVADEHDEFDDTRLEQRGRIVVARMQMLAAARAAVMERRDLEPEAADEVLRRLDLHSEIN